MKEKNYAIKIMKDGFETIPLSKAEEWQIILHYAILTDNIKLIRLNAVSLQFWFKDHTIQSGQLTYIAGIVFEFTESLNNRLKERKIRISAKRKGGQQ